MKIMITSFGVEHSLFSGAESGTMFSRMPPVSFRHINQRFTPDYELLLLYDSMIMDETSFDRLVGGSVAAYSHVSETFQALRAEGRIELRDFSSTLRAHAQLLNRMTEHDLKSLEQWVEPLRASLTLWRHFSQLSMDLMQPSLGHWSNHTLDGDASEVRMRAVLVHELAHMMMENSRGTVATSTLVEEALETSTKRKRKVHRDALREVLQGYLTYVNANLILSQQLDLGFHDWLDFTPFYAAKFLSVGVADNPVQAGRAQLERLFTIPFPELAIRSPRALMEALNDKRVADLRRLVAEAAAGRVQFDEAFAKSVLTEVFHTSERAKRWRSIVGYATLPIHLIPWVGSVAQKVVEEGVAISLERKLREKHRWFYMLSEIASSTKGPNDSM